MNKIALILAGLCLFTASLAAQTNPNPVRVPTPAPTPTEKRPPVLQGGGSRTLPQTSPTPPATTDGTVEEDNDVIRVETNLVTMPVSVLDRDGRFISGLQQRDFQIFENGVQQKVEYFQTVEQPFTVILLIDVSPSTQFQIDEIQDSAIAFVNQLRPGDRVQIISFDERVNILSPVTSDRRVLRDAILRTEFGDGTSLYEAVDFVVQRQLKQIQGRKAVVLFTDGVDTTSRRANYQSTIREVEENEALFYPIRYDTSSDMYGGWGTGGGGGGGYGGYGNRRQRRIDRILGGILGGNQQGGGGGGGRGGGGRNNEYETARTYLDELARSSGGRSFEARNDLRAAFTGIAEELRRQYSIGYYPEKPGQAGERKQIRIRVMRANLVVRAKTSYIVGSTTGR